jgi:TonB-linked SusC/RagA family outer membrane protein
MLIMKPWAREPTNFYELNWQDEMFDLGTFQEYNLAFSGGMENLSYLVSGSYLKDVGIIKPAEYDRYTFRANINSKLNKRISIVSDAYLTHTYRSNVNDAGLGWNQGVVNACLQYPPFLPIYDERTGNFFPNPIRPNVDSPYALANGIWNDRYNTNINGNFRLNIDIISGLRFRSEWFGRLSFGDSRSFSDRINTYIGRDKNGTGSDSKSNSLGTTIQNILEFSKTIGRHDLYAMAGHIAEHSWSHSLSTFGYDYPTDYLILVRNATQFEPPNDGIGEGRHYAVISRINYSYNNKYLVQVNFRADGSDNFAGGNKWGYFPSASFGWKISEESFMADFVNIDLLKVRFGLGQTGNDAIGFAYLSTYGSGSRSKYPIFGDDNPIAYYTRGLANPNLKWEETFETNLAIDFASFRGRLNLSLELYSRNSYDLLYSKPVPITTGSRTVQANLGKVNNKGIEFMATTHNISNRNFSWKTDFNISYNHNEVISLGEEYEAVTSGYRWVYPGYPIDAFFAYRVDRILQEDDFESGDLIEGIPIQIGAGPGDIKFKDFKNTEDIDLDGTPDIAITDEDRVYIGNPLPSITYGVTNSLSFKGLTLNVFFQGISGNKIYNSTRVTSEGMNDYFNQFATILDRWTPTNTDTDMPRAVSGDPNKNTRESDRWIENGWFFRVKDITLSYSLPSSITSRVGILRTTFYVTGQNWITLTDYSGYDPEVGSEDNGAYPQVKSLIFGINLSF